jgi:hypothetical protein
MVGSNYQWWMVAMQVDDIANIEMWKQEWANITNPEMWVQEWTAFTSPEMWKKEWTAFTSAPYIILPFIVVGWLAGWWFRGKMSKETIVGFREGVAAINERLKLANDRLDRAKDDLANLNKDFQVYKSEVATKGSGASPLKVDVAIQRIRDDNIITGSILSQVLENIENANIGRTGK